MGTLMKRSNMLEAGRRILLEPEVENQQNPGFENNSDFNFGIFKEKFDFVVARSVWTHAAKKHIQTMLDEFSAAAANTGDVFLLFTKSPCCSKKLQGRRVGWGKSRLRQRWKRPPQFHMDPE